MITTKDHVFPKNEKCAFAQIFLKFTTNMPGRPGVLQQKSSPP
jgi:hypothetical protein